MKPRLASLLLLLALLLFLPGNAHAQNYSFSLDEETVHAYWGEDGSLTLEYELVFTNDAFASPIDFVDIGLPNPNYSLGDVSAQVDGHPIVDIERSPYVDYGIALGLGSNAIRPGDSGLVYARIEGIRGVLYEDTEGDDYASAVFSPTWFDSQFVHGSTDLTVVYHLPPGVQPDQPRWHAAPSGFPQEPEAGFDEQGRITYTWRNADARGDQQYLFGASFPASYVPESAIVRPSFWERIGIDPEVLLGIAIFCGIGLFILGIPILAIIGQRRRRMQYLSPKVKIEGHGIKRGLTAIEAAILMEEPMDKIMTMVLFSVLKKGAATVTKREPLELEVEERLPEGLRPYEVEFLQAFQESTGARRRRKLQDSMVALVRSVTKKMKGFSARETRDYYRDIMRKAWAQVEAAETPEVKSEKYDEVMEWTMLDRNYEERTRDIFRHQPVFVPMWWHRYDPGYGGRVSGAPRPAPVSAGRPSGAGGPSLPHLPGSDFAASVVNGVQNFSAGVIGSLSDFTSGVTKVTNPPPPPSRSSGGWSSGGGGGSSCACACACAGCACACAGGGR